MKWISQLLIQYFYDMKKSRDFSCMLFDLQREIVWCVIASTVEDDDV